MEIITFPKKISKAGHSEVISLPQDIREALALNVGELVEVTIRKLKGMFSILVMKAGLFCEETIMKGVSSQVCLTV